MFQPKTAGSSNTIFLSEDKKYIQRARLTLPLLVRQAKAGTPIIYSDLATEINISNARNLNYILAAIGNTLKDLEQSLSIEIPPIQCLVINKRDGLPGEGVGWFISKEEFDKLTKSQQQHLLNFHFAKIFAFQHWDRILAELGIEPVIIDKDEDAENARILIGGRESEHHRIFKEYIFNNPNVLGLRKNTERKSLEFELFSADRLDIFFEYSEAFKVGVEVKSSISSDADIFRGLYQCVKYKALIEAGQIYRNETPNCRVILALQGLFPAKFLIIKNLLGIEVIDKIQIS